MFDVIIAGGGVAGCYLAHLLGVRNPDINVLVLEKNKKVTLKDSGLVSKHITNFIQEKKLIEHEVTEMTAVSPSGHKFSLKSETPYAYILERVKFGEHLRKIAVKNATIKYETVTSIERSHHFITVRTDTGEYRCRILVGCDGAASSVRKFAGIQRPKLFAGILTRTNKELNHDTIKVFLNKYYSPDFFSWIIPQTNEYGLMSGVRPKDYFNFFKKKQCLPDGQTFAHLIPIGYTKSYADRVLLLGDSCGQVKPISGGGIIFSLTCSGFAAETIVSCFEKRKTNEKFLSQYERLWKNELEKEIKMQLIARKLYKNLTNKDLDNIFRKFGPEIEKINEFDYDKISKSIWKLPKTKMISMVPLLLKNIF